MYQANVLALVVAVVVEVPVRVFLPVVQVVVVVVVVKVPANALRAEGLCVGGQVPDLAAILRYIGFFCMNKSRSVVGISCIRYLPVKGEHQLVHLRDWEDS